MNPRTTTATGLFLTLLILGGCSGGAKGDPDNRGDFKVTLVSTGQGQIFPYRIRAVDSRGVPTSTILNIDSPEVLTQNARTTNGVLPVATFPQTATLPNGAAGNQFVVMRFSHKLQLDSILSNLLANATTNSGLTTAIGLLAYDPNTEQTTTLRGRGFVNGFTYVNQGGVLALVKAVDADENGVQILEPVATGFPRGFSGDVDLVANNSFVFVADRDNNLSTFETFDPFDQDILIRMQITNAVRDSENQVLEQEVCTATTVGTDPNPPDVLGFTTVPRITPGNGQGNIDPTTTVRIRFNKPVQPAEVGTFFSQTNMTPQPGGVSMDVTISGNSFGMLYYADPETFGNMCDFIITPAFNFPGNETVSVRVNAATITGVSTGANLGRDISTTFRTGEGPGIVNAPVAPDAIYISIGGSDPGVAAIDLNGYGQTTGTANPNDPLESRWLSNPNIGQAGIVPPLSAGRSSVDAGSRGPLTLVEDTRGNTRLLRAPLIGQIADIHIGPPLDVVFNNANINVNASGANQVNPLTQAAQPGNSITIAPHPNPPPLVFPPPNLSRAIFGQEPTMTSSMPANPIAVQTLVPPCRQSPVNQLVAGTVNDYQSRQIEGVFFGPQPPPESPPPPPPFCPYTSRQQIGHFLYVLDPENRQVLVVNSNRFTVLDTIRLSDPFAMTMSPTLGVLAVANRASSTVSFINIDPRSAAFNTVVGETRVAEGPTTLSWQPDGESVLVLSPQSNQLTVVSGLDFSVQTSVSGNLNAAFALAVTERFIQVGNLSGVFYGYILNKNGSVAVYESGPSGVNGIGFDDIIGTADVTFRRATNVRLDYTSSLSAVFITHTDESGVGQVSKLELTSSPTGQLPTQQNSGGFILPPTFRQKQWTVVQKFGGSDPSVPGNQRLTGNSPIDVLQDEVFNFGAFINQVTVYNAGAGASILQHSSKGSTLINPLTGLPVVPFVPRYLFVALQDVGKVDIFDLTTRVRVKTLDVPGVTALTSYWKQ